MNELDVMRESNERLTKLVAELEKEVANMNKALFVGGPLNGKVLEVNSTWELTGAPSSGDDENLYRKQKYIIDSCIQIFLFVYEPILSKATELDHCGIERYKPDPVKGW